MFLRGLLVSSLFSVYTVLGGNLVLDGNGGNIVIYDDDGTRTDVQARDIGAFLNMKKPRNGYEIRHKPSGVYTFTTSQGNIDAYVDNDYQDGGWVLVAKAGGCEKDMQDFLNQGGVMRKRGKKSHLLDPTRDYTSYNMFGREQLNALFEASEFKQMRYDFEATATWTDPDTGTRHNDYDGIYTAGSDYMNSNKNYFCQRVGDDAQGTGVSGFDAWDSLLSAREWSNGGMSTDHYMTAPGTGYHVWSGDLPAGVGRITSSSPRPGHEGGVWYWTAMTLDEGRLAPRKMNMGKHGGMCWGDIERGHQWMMTYNVDPARVSGCELRHTNIYVR